MTSSFHKGYTLVQPYTTSTHFINHHRININNKIILTEIRHPSYFYHSTQKRLDYYPSPHLTPFLYTIFYSARHILHHIFFEVESSNPLIYFVELYILFEFCCALIRYRILLYKWVQTTDVEQRETRGRNHYNLPLV